MDRSTRGAERGLAKLAFADNAVCWKAEKLKNGNVLSFWARKEFARSQLLVTFNTEQLPVLFEVISFQGGFDPTKGMPPRKDGTEVFRVATKWHTVEDVKVPQTVQSLLSSHGDLLDGSLISVVAEIETFGESSPTYKKVAESLKPILEEAARTAGTKTP